MEQQLAKKKATYEDLYSVPENMTGEIIDGELIVSPRPSYKHAQTSFSLSGIIEPLYQFGGGSPGGWIILPEVEIKFGEHTLVPDFAGWKEERFVEPIETNWISVSPDWVCEIASPGTFRLDRFKKMPIYAEFKVPYIWLIDPIEKTLEVYKLESGRWVLFGTYCDNDKVRAEPFQEIEINLANLWWK